MTEQSGTPQAEPMSDSEIIRRLFRALISEHSSTMLYADLLIASLRREVAGREREAGLIVRAERAEAELKTVKGQLDEAQTTANDAQDEASRQRKRAKKARKRAKRAEAALLQANQCAAERGWFTWLASIIAVTMTIIVLLYTFGVIRPHAQRVAEHRANRLERELREARDAAAVPQDVFVHVDVEFDQAQLDQLTGAIEANTSALNNLNSALSLQAHEAPHSGPNNIAPQIVVVPDDAPLTWFDLDTFPAYGVAMEVKQTVDVAGGQPGVLRYDDGGNVHGVIRFYNNAVSRSDGQKLAVGDRVFAAGFTTAADGFITQMVVSNDPNLAAPRP